MYSKPIVQIDLAELEEMQKQIAEYRILVSFNDACKLRAMALKELLNFSMNDILNRREYPESLLHFLKDLRYARSLSEVDIEEIIQTLAAIKNNCLAKYGHRFDEAIKSLRK